MKNISSFIKRIICLVTLIAVCLSTLSLSAMASENNSIEKIDPQLSLLLSDMSDNDTTSVSIWFKDINKSELAEKTIENLNDMVICDDLPSEVLDVVDMNTAKIDVSYTELEYESVQSIIVEERKNAQKLYSEYNADQFSIVRNSFKKDYNVIYSCDYAPNIVVTACKSDILAIEKCDNVDFIYSYEEDLFSDTSDVSDYTSTTSSTTLTFEDCLNAIGADSTLTGDGIKIGLIESYIPDTNLDVLGDSNIVIDPVSSNTEDEHASIIASELVGKYSNGTKTFTGMVSGATLYCTTINDEYPWKSRIEWLISNGVNVINISNSLVPIEETFTTVNDVSRWIDHVSYQHNVTVVAATGYLSTLTNGAINTSPLAYARNAILVGAIDFTKNGSSYVFSRYSGRSAYSSSGIYFPQVVAPSNPREIPDITGPVYNSQRTGNSFSAPFVVGAVVQLIDKCPSLSANPTLIKSLIMAGANGEKSSTNIDTSGTDMDREYGAGVLNVANSIGCLSTNTMTKMYTGTSPANSSSNINLSLNINKSGTVRMALNWQTSSCFDAHEYHYSSDDLNYSAFSFFKLTATSPDGVVYTSFDVQNPFQLLVFDVPSSDLGTYSITISRHGPSGYSTPISLAIYGGNRLY